MTGGGPGGFVRSRLAPRFFGRRFQRQFLVEIIREDLYTGTLPFGERRDAAF